jgi:hypothetical protein
MVSCPGIDRKVLGKRSYPKFELSWSKWRVTSHQEFRMMSQWARLGLLDSQKQMFVERKGLLAPYYWHRRVLSQVRDFDKGVCRDSRRSSLPSPRVRCCEDETGPLKREIGDTRVLARVAGTVLGCKGVSAEEEMVKGEKRFHGVKHVKTGRMKARRMTHKNRREQLSRHQARQRVKTWTDKNERNCLQESLQTAFLRC